jgi:HEAT repeat protein
MNDDAIAIALEDADPEVRLAAIREVAAHPQVILTEAALDALVRSIGANRKVVQRGGAEALAALSLHDPRVVEKARAMLSHHDSRARWGAAYALGLLNVDDALDLRAVPALVEAIASSDGDVRWAATELLVRRGKTHRDAVSRQLIALVNDGNLNARKMALYCLRDVGGARDELLAAAENACRDHQSLLKMAALSLITRVENPGDRAAALAIRLLEGDPDAGVRRCAAVALGHLGNLSHQVTDALTRAANAEGDIYMKRVAQGALARLGAGA